MFLLQVVSTLIFCTNADTNKSTQTIPPTSTTRMPTFLSLHYLALSRGSLPSKMLSIGSWVQCSPTICWWSLSYGSSRGNKVLCHPLIVDCSGDPDRRYGSSADLLRAHEQLKTRWSASGRWQSPVSGKACACKARGSVRVMVGSKHCFEFSSTGSPVTCRWLFDTRFA